MKRLLLIALLAPLMTMAQTLTTRTFDGGAGVGKINLLYWDPGKITSDTTGLIFFNGRDESGSDITKLYNQGIPNLLKSGAWKPSYPVLCPQTPNPWGPDRGAKPIYVLAVLREALSGAYHIDRKRLFFTGLSYGSAYIFNYMQYATDADYIQPAGIIAMSMEIYGTVGDSKKGTDALGGNDLRFLKVPTWMLCGTSDNFYQGQKRYTDQQVKAGAPMTFTPYSGGHCCWIAQYNSSLQPVSVDTWIKQKAAALTPVIIPPPVIVNKAPVPAIAPVTADTNRWVILDGSGSYDPDGTIDSTVFNLVVGPSPARIISSSCGLTAGVVGLIPGTYIFKLTVWDDKATSSSALVTVIVNAPPVTTIVTIPLSFSILGTSVNKNLIVKSDGSYSIQ